MLLSETYIGAGNTVRLFNGKTFPAMGSTADKVEILIRNADGSRSFQWITKSSIESVIVEGFSGQRTEQPFANAGYIENLCHDISCAGNGQHAFHAAGILVR